MSNQIKAEAKRLGFYACGIARAEPVENESVREFKEWINKGGHAGMQYLEHHEDLRFDPRLLVPGTKSIVCVALNYSPHKHVKGFADYAIGRDYHDIVKQKLHELATYIYGVGNQSTRYRAFSDSAPILERYWAQRAGIGLWDETTC